jgi:ParB family chromosome partitioning protein
MSVLQKILPERLFPAKNSGGEDDVINVLNKVVEIHVRAIAPNPAQPRVIFGDYELSQLAISIRQNGILQPLTVRRVGGFDESAIDGFRYELIAGERRLRAAKLAGFERVPCIIMEATTEKSALLAIMENIQRADLNYIEEAFAIKRLIDFLGVTQEEAAVKLGMAQSTVANKLRLLRLSDREKAMVLRERLNERQARALLKLPNELREEAISRISRDGLNTAMTDKLVEELMNPCPQPLGVQLEKLEKYEKTGKSERPRKHKAFYIKHAELYINTFNHTIDSMQKAGIACEATQNRTDEFVEYVVRIPLKSPK